MSAQLDFLPGHQWGQNSTHSGPGGYSAMSGSRAASANIDKRQIVAGTTLAALLYVLTDPH